MADAFGQAREETIDGAGGLKIFVRSLRPAGKVRGVVAIVPGFNSHSGYYGWVAEQFVAQGLAAYAVDLRGRGKSDGERFYVQQFADYVSDVADLVKLAKAREPGLPVFLLGHSAGGVVACIYTIENQAGLAGLVCESFAHQVPAPDFALAALKGVPLEARRRRNRREAMSHRAVASTGSFAGTASPTERRPRRRWRRRRD